MRRLASSIGFPLAAVFLTLLVLAGSSWSADKGQPGADHEKEMQEALDWLDHYLSVQVIFRQEDVIKLRENVAKMTPEQLQAWLSRTKQVRERLSSPEWARTQAHLSDFLSKQAIYSDEEIEKMRADAAEMTPDQLMDLLDKIDNKFAEMTRMQRSSGQRRQLDMVERDARQARQREANQQKDAFAARDAYLANQSAARAQAAASRSNAPLFGTSQSKAAANAARSRYRPPPPIITSRDAARITVERNVFGDYGWGW